MDPITLDPLAYWRLRARMRDVQAVELELLKLRMEAERRLNAAKALVDADLAELRKTHPVPNVFGWDDATLQLVPMSVTKKGDAQ